MTTGAGATTRHGRQSPGFAFGSPLATSWRLAVQTSRRVELLVLAVTLALGPHVAEPVGGEQQLPDAGEKGSQNPDRNTRDSWDSRDSSDPKVPHVPNILGITELSGCIRQPHHPYRLLIRTGMSRLTRTGMSRACGVTLRVRTLTRHGAA